MFEEKYFAKPVVVTDIPSNFEMIEDGKNGLIVKRETEEIYRAVKTLLDNEALRQRIAVAPALGFAGNKEIIQEIEKRFEMRNEK